MEPIKAYYFAPENGKLRYGDNRVIRKGITHKVKGELKLCANGLHASINLLDALKYANSTKLWLVELSGYTIIGEDKLCAAERTYIKSIDITDILWEFSRKQALINIAKIKPYCEDTSYKLIVKYLNTGDLVIRSAAESAARSATRSATRSARSAAWSAAWSAAESAAWSAANEMLTQMANEK